MKTGTALPKFVERLVNWGMFLLKRYDAKKEGGGKRINQKDK